MHLKILFIFHGMYLWGWMQARCKTYVEVRGQLWGLNSGYQVCATSALPHEPGQELIFQKGKQRARMATWVKADATLSDNPHGGRRKLTQVPSALPTCTAAYALAHTLECTHTHTSTCTCTHMYIYPYAHTCTCAHIHPHAHTEKNKCI